MPLHFFDAVMPLTEEMETLTGIRPLQARNLDEIWLQPNQDGRKQIVPRYTPSPFVGCGVTPRLRLAPAAAASAMQQSANKTTSDQKSLLSVRN